MNMPIPGFARSLQDPVRKLILVFCGIMILTGCAIYAITAIFQDRIIEQDAIRSAEFVATEVQVSRTTFTEKVVDKLKKEGFGISLDFEHHLGYVPIPAQYLRFVGANINKQSEGLFSFNLLSKWNLHENQDVHDDFEKWAWTQFEQQDQKNPTGPIDWIPRWRFENINGVKTLRYMRADPAAEIACVECHNEQEKKPEIHAQRVAAGVTPDKIWQRHQLLGAIEVQIPVERMEKLATAQNHALLLLMLVSLCALGIAAFFSVRDLKKQRNAATFFEGERDLIRQKNQLIEQKNALIEQKNKELEQTNRALELAGQVQEEQRSELTRFLAVASHDLRQPMHTLNLYLGALAGYNLPDEALPALENARNCARIMDSMFLALLNLSRLDAQVVKPYIEAFPIASVLTRLSIEFAPQAEAKGIAFQVVSSPEWAESDVALVEQILSNLIANAVRYTEKGQITISCCTLGDKLRVAVKDTGIGISSQQQKLVFDEFFQLGNPARDVTRGLGLGLAIVKRLSDLLRIPISVDSMVGEGSTFAILLDRTTPQSVEAQPIHPPLNAPGTLSGKTILVADDEKGIRDAMRILLEQWGCTVITAKSSSEAIATLANLNLSLDVLICDYRLGVNETGMEFIEKIRNEFNRDISAILITGDTTSDLIQATESGGSIILHKPLQADVLYSALVQLLTWDSAE
jgi:signal transduction histidine kinase/ActR/RegA family two-component response regulator